MKRKTIKGLITAITIAILVGGVTFLSGCTSLESTMKNWESDTKGLARNVKVYSITGELLAEYSGKSVRIESENSESNSVSVLVDNKKHKFVNATVVVEEQ